MLGYFHGGVGGVAFYLYSLNQGFKGVKIKCKTPNRFRVAPKSTETRKSHEVR